MKKTKGIHEGTKKMNVQRIAVHCTGTRRISVNELNKLPYHYLVTASGKLLPVKPLSCEDLIINVAWLGGRDKHGNSVDNRTEQQNQTLFTTLVLLTEQYVDAKIIGADECHQYGYPNPGFDVKTWLGSFVPAFLLAA